MQAGDFPILVAKTRSVVVNGQFTAQAMQRKLQGIIRFIFLE